MRVAKTRVRKKHSLETLEKMRIAHTNKRHIGETIQKMRVSQKEAQNRPEVLDKHHFSKLGVNNPNYKDGKHVGMIGNERRKEVYDKQKGICGWCKKPMEWGGDSVSSAHCHHKDLSLNNNELNNLLSMHNSCHRKVHRVLEAALSRVLVDYFLSSNKRIKKEIVELFQKEMMKKGVSAVALREILPFDIVSRI